MVSLSGKKIGKCKITFFLHSQKWWSQTDPPCVSQQFMNRIGRINYQMKGIIVPYNDSEYFWNRSTGSGDMTRTSCFGPFWLISRVSQNPLNQIGCNNHQMKGNKISKYPTELKWKINGGGFNWWVENEWR